MLLSTLYLIVSLTRTVEEGTGSVSYKVPVYGRWLLCLLSPVAVALGIDQVFIVCLCVKLYLFLTALKKIEGYVCLPKNSFQIMFLGPPPCCLPAQKVDEKNYHIL